MGKLCTTDEINRALTERDPALGALIARVGHVRITLSDDYLSALLSAIVGQQLSGKVADVIWGRFKALMDGDVRPEKVIAAPEADLRAIGLSSAKVVYAKALSEAVACGAVRLDALDAMEDEEIIRHLTAVKGIGNWTAEMFLIFSLGRPDVFSCGDGGLQRAAQWLYDIEPKKDELLRISSLWKPYRTYASLYLWEVLNQKLV
jgi:DNA-3-methyladenine glycosylase II